MPSRNRNIFIASYAKLIAVSSYFQSFALLLFRLAWGWELFESGRGHLTHIPDTVANFQSWNIPMPTASAYISGSTELVGGILLMAGLLTRLISIPLIVNFIVAFVTASRDNVVHAFSQDPKNLIDDAAFPFLLTALLLFAFGPGKISLDHLLRISVFKRHDVPRQPI